MKALEQSKQGMQGISNKANTNVQSKSEIVKGTSNTVNSSNNNNKRGVSDVKRLVLFMHSKGNNYSDLVTLLYMFIHIKEINVYHQQLNTKNKFISQVFNVINSYKQCISNNSLEPIVNVDECSIAFTEQFNNILSKQQILPKIFQLYIQQLPINKKFINNIYFDIKCSHCNNAFIQEYPQCMFYDLKIKDILSLNNPNNNNDLLYLLKLAFLTKPIKCNKCSKDKASRIKINNNNNELRYFMLSCIWEDALIKKNEYIKKVYSLLNASVMKDSFYADMLHKLKIIVFTCGSDYVSLFYEDNRFVLYLSNIFMCFNNLNDALKFMSDNLKRNYYPEVIIYEVSKPIQQQQQQPSSSIQKKTK